MQTTPGLLHFFSQIDALGYAVLLVLVTMSIATWYLIVSKWISHRRIHVHSAKFLDAFWHASDMQSVADRIKTDGVNDPFSHLTHHGLRAAEQYRDKRGGRMIESGSPDEFLTRALRRAIIQDTARMEYGHTVLASIASSAPFVGLLGTVWGIYRALMAIGVSGQGSLDKVAGPVGEALIMTAIGLSVAIPAVLAYNAFTRGNRLLLTEMDGFAHDLFAFMSTGNRNDAPEQAPKIAKLRNQSGAA